MIKKFLLLVFLLAALPAAAQVTTASIGGRIVDDNGPVEGVTVVVIHQPSNTQYYTTTNARGWYQLSDVLPGGPYTVRIHYFSYKPLTVRELYTYAGQHSVIDANLEAGTTDIHVDDAATSLRIGENLGGGVVPVAPGTYDLVGQRVYTAVPFDVRQEAALDGVSRLQMTPVGTNRFHGSAYGYFGSAGLAGATVSTPLFNEDYVLFGGLQYDFAGDFSGAGRIDARLGASNRLDLSGGRLAGENWAMGGFTSQIGDGRASNRLQTGWSGSPAAKAWRVSDDFTLSAGAQRLLFGVQTTYGQLPDSSFTRVGFYLQDAVRLGRRMTLQAGLRFDFPFAFSPRVSLRYDVLGTGALVLRAGSAVYGVHGEGTVWKNMAAADFRLPARFVLSLEGVYGQTWRKPFYISTRNILDSRYALTARLERPFAGNLWAVASYTRSDGPVSDQVIGGLSYTAKYLGHLATTLAVLYNGNNFIDDLSPASVSWTNSVEARLSQDLILSLGGRDHTLQLTGYYRSTPLGTEWLAGLRYSL